MHCTIMAWSTPKRVIIGHGFIYGDIYIYIPGPSKRNKFLLITLFCSFRQVSRISEICSETANCMFRSHFGLILHLPAFLERLSCGHLPKIAVGHVGWHDMVQGCTTTTPNKVSFVRFIQEVAPNCWNRWICGKILQIWPPDMRGHRRKMRENRRKIRGSPKPTFLNMPVLLEQVADWAPGLLRGSHAKLRINGTQHGNFDDCPQVEKV